MAKKDPPPKRQCSCGGSGAVRVPRRRVVTDSNGKKRNETEWVIETCKVCKGSGFVG